MDSHPVYASVYNYLIDSLTHAAMHAQLGLYIQTFPHPMPSFQTASPACSA